MERVVKARDNALFEFVVLYGHGPDPSWQLQFDPIYLKHLARAIEQAEARGWSLAHGAAQCGHARANYKDPLYGTAEYQGNERCEACAAEARGFAAGIEKAAKIADDYYNRWQFADSECRGDVLRCSSTIEIEILALAKQEPKP
jgi:hypothetical protein